MVDPSGVLSARDDDGEDGLPRTKEEYRSMAINAIRQSVRIAAVAVLGFGVWAAGDRTAAETLYAVGQALSTVYKISPNGTLSTFVSGHMDYPEGLAVDSKGDLFVANFLGNTITEFAPNGTSSTFASGLDGPADLVFDKNGDLYETDESSGNIYEFTPSGVRSTFASGLVAPLALAIDRDNNVYVGIGATNSILEITQGGAQSTFATGVTPYALAFDASGNLFESDGGPYDTAHIYKFTSNGTRSTFASGQANMDFLAFDSAGNLYASQYANGYIVKFTPMGAESDFASIGESGSPTGMAFAPAPEPPTLALVAAGAVGLAGFVWRRRSAARRTAKPAACDQ
jgi:sugar lactone lactonase YvrE